MTDFVINSTDSLQLALGKIRSAYDQHKFLRLKMKTGKDRSLDQNSISHAWYNQLSREMPQHDALGWKCECKLLHGVPILRSEDSEFREFYDAAIKGRLSYEEKISAMKFIPVTSIMRVAQLSKYLDSMRSHFFKYGVHLEFPEE